MPITKEYDEYGSYVDDIAQGVIQRTLLSGGSIVHKCQSAAWPTYQVLRGAISSQWGVQFLWTIRAGGSKMQFLFTKMVELLLFSLWIYSPFTILPKALLPSRGFSSKNHLLAPVRGGIKKTVFFLLPVKRGGSRPKQKKVIRKYSDFFDQRGGSHPQGCRICCSVAVLLTGTFLFCQALLFLV